MTVSTGQDHKPRRDAINISEDEDNSGGFCALGGSSAKVCVQMALDDLKHQDEDDQAA